MLSSAVAIAVLTATGGLIGVLASPVAGSSANTAVSSPAAPPRPRPRRVVYLRVAAPAWPSVTSAPAVRRRVGSRPAVNAPNRVAAAPVTRSSGS